MYLGDCLEVMKTFEPKSFDHTFTSPPYNRKRNDKYEHYTDIKDNYFEWQKSCLEEMLRVTRRYVIYNTQTNFYNRSDIYSLIGHFSQKIIDIFVWEKTNPLPASGKSVTNAVEYFLVLGDEKLVSNRTYTKNILRTSVNSKMPKNHKAVMKPEVADFFIETFTKEGETVLDPFMGVGTTGLSCKKFNRGFVGIELNNTYFEMASQAMTGKSDLAQSECLFDSEKL